jgi:hypothetical protein
MLLTKKQEIMKKSLTIIVFTILLTAGSFAQNVDDALRYSQLFYNGTARFTSMGGAFTALGGDISSLSQNPAGIGVFRSSEITLSPQMYHINTIAGLNGKRSDDYIYNFNLAQGGIVINFLNNIGETGLLNLNFGYSFNKTNNYNQSIIIQGTSTKSSLTDYFADISSGWFKDELQTNVPDAYLAWNTWLIDTLSGSNVNYGTVYSNYGDTPPSIYGQNVKRYIENTGYTGEHSLSFGGNYSNKIIFGATLGITRLSYSSHYEHIEKTDALLASKFTNFNYTFHYSNSGMGYGLKMGAIIKPIDVLRIGIAFHSPTLFRINEYVYDNMTSNFSDGGKYESINEPVRFNYALTTPFRALAGAALQIKKIGLVSMDYEFIDYSSARFSETGDGYNYSEKNRSIRDNLRSVSNLRLGGELRLNKIYLRGGYGYYGRPFGHGDLNSELSYSTLSGGAGFREQNVFVDFGFTSLINPHKYVVYDSSAETLVSDMDITRKMFTVTFGYKFVY